jgi:uncharacterized protein (DUF2336 family)
MEARDIFGLEALTALGSRSGLDMRPTLLRVLTDLYVQRVTHTVAEERHYTELALRLLDAVDVPTRIAVAKRFAGYVSPPLRVVQALARDLPKVAAEIGAHPLLQSRTAASAPPSTPRQKPTMHDAANTSTPLVPASDKIDLVTAAKLSEAFFAAGALERGLILRNLHIVAPLASRPILGARQPAVGQELERAALARRSQDFTQHLAGALRIPRDLAQRIADDQLGEPVVVAVKAFDISREVLYRILMFLNPAVGHSVERVHALAALFDEITSGSAESMVAIWQALRRDEHATATHRPLLWDDKMRRRARPEKSPQHLPALPIKTRRDAS